MRKPKMEELFDNPETLDEELEYYNDDELDSNDDLISLLNFDDKDSKSIITDDDFLGF